MQLGAVPFPSGLFNTDLYLEVLISDDGGTTWETLSPRQKVTTAAYAMKSQDADTLDGKLPADFAKSLHDHDGDYVDEGQSNSIWSHMIVDGTITAADLGPGSVGTSEIIDGSVNAADLADGTALAEIIDDDGAASNLDADMLDGQHASSFATSGHSHSPTCISREGAVAYLDNWFTTIDASCNAGETLVSGGFKAWNWNSSKDCKVITIDQTTALGE